MASEGDRALRTARQALKSFQILRQNGYTPDMVVLDAAWEYWLYGPGVFPDAFVACYADSLPPVSEKQGPGNGFFRSLLQARQLLNSHLCISRTLGEASPHAASLRTAVALPYPVDTAFFSPGGEGEAAQEKPLLLVAPDVEDVVHLCGMVNAILSSMAQRRVILLLSDTAARIRAAEMLHNCPPACRERLSLPDTMPLQEYRNLLRAAAAVILVAPQPRPGFLLEAMSCGAPVVLCAATALPGMFRHGWNIIQSDQQELARQTAMLLQNQALLDRLRIQARRTVVEHFNLGAITARHRQLLENACSRWQSARANAIFKSDSH